jgi:hypothetical protein
MKRWAAILAALAGGCSYPNHYDTSAEEAEYAERTEQILQRQVVALEEYPQINPQEFTDPDLEAWRDTVLATADDRTLLILQNSIERKIAWLEVRCGELVRTDEHNREPQLTSRVWQLRVERMRLKMVEGLIADRAPRRID